MLVYRAKENAPTPSAPAFMRGLAKIFDFCLGEQTPSGCSKAAATSLVNEGGKALYYTNKLYSNLALVKKGLDLGFGGFDRSLKGKIPAAAPSV